MSQTRLQAQFIVNGTVTDPDSAVLADQDSPTYGVRRTDTNASVVAAGTALTRAVATSGNPYYYVDVTDPLPDLTYQWAVRWVRAGHPNAYGYFTTKGSASSVPVCAFFTWQQFVNKYGLSNIIKATNKDSTQNTGSATNPIPSGQPNWYAVQDSFNWAADEVNGNMTGGVLKTPMDFTPNVGVCPPRFSRLVMTLAWADMYFARGMDDNPKNRSGHRFQMLVDGVYNSLMWYKAGTMQLREAVQNTDNVATAVTYSDVIQSRPCWRYVDGQFLFRFGP